MTHDRDGSHPNPQGWPAAGRWSHELEDFSDGQRQLEKARARLLNPRAPGARRSVWKLRPLVLWALGLAPLVAAAAFLVRSVDPAAPPSFTVQAGASGPRLIGKLGSAFSSQAAQPSVLSFWEGSEVRLLPGAKARVAELGAHGAKLALLDGEIEVRITASPASTWAVEVDSFQVLVLGTHFFVSKLAAGPGLRIRLVEGSVAVSGPCLSAPVRVSAGEQRLLRCERTAEVAAPASTSATGSPAVAAPSGAPSGPALERLAREATAPKAPSALRQEVELMESIRAALSVDPARALALIHEAGQRFPGGSLSEERQAFEALALDRLGRATEAKALAERFLRRYPNGSFSARMKGIVSKASH